MSLKRIWPAALAAVAAVGLVPATGRATSMSAPPTVADMVRDASEIVVGTVKDVREVRQGALPVMEVEVAVSERIRGGAGAIMAFRQLSPTASKGAPQNGVRFLGNVPGMPRYEKGERVLLFLGPASSGGFRTPIGLQQGKFSLSGGNALNAMNNRGLFRGVTAPRANDGESSVLAATHGPVNAPALVGLVRRAVTEGFWNGGAR
jgi:hypothetical protein